jgi:sulfur carrier protein
MLASHRASAEPTCYFKGIMALIVTVNGQNRSFAELESPTNLLEVVAQMGLKADRVAIEHNGEISPRARWSGIPISSGDKLEIVHFVGGGLPAAEWPLRLLDRS